MDTGRDPFPPTHLMQMQQKHMKRRARMKPAQNSATAIPATTPSLSPRRLVMLMTGADVAGVGVVDMSVVAVGQSSHVTLHAIWRPRLAENRTGDTFTPLLTST